MDINTLHIDTTADRGSLCFPNQVARRVRSESDFEGLRPEDSQLKSEPHGTDAMSNPVRVPAGTVQLGDCSKEGVVACHQDVIIQVQRSGQRAVAIVHEWRPTDERRYQLVHEETGRKAALAPLVQKVGAAPGVIGLLV